MDGGTHSMREIRKKEAQVPPVIIVWQTRKGHTGQRRENRRVVRRMDESVPSIVCHPPRSPLYTPMGRDTPGRWWTEKDPDAGNIGVNESKSIAIIAHRW